MFKRSALYIVYGIVLIGLIVAIVLAFSSSNDSDKTTEVSETSQDLEKRAEEKKRAASEKSSSAGSKAGDMAKNEAKQTPPATSAPAAAAPSTPAPSTPAPAAAAPATPSATGNLANTGPGETAAALFIAATVSGAVGYSVIQRKKLV